MIPNLYLASAVVAVALAAATAAVAGTLSATATVTGASGASLTLPANPALSTTLDGTDQTVPYTATLTVVDARGTGAGWNLTVSATAFADGSGHSFAAGSVSGVVSACATGSTCTLPTNTVAYPLTVSGSSVKFFNAASGTGLGKVEVTPTVRVAVPGNAYAGSYVSTVTLAIVTGP